MLYLRLIEAGRGGGRAGREVCEKEEAGGGGGGVGWGLGGVKRAASSRGTFVVLAEAWAWRLGEKREDGAALSRPHWAKWQRESSTAPWGPFDGMWSYKPRRQVRRCLRGGKMGNRRIRPRTHTQKNGRTTHTDTKTQQWKRASRSLVEVLWGSLRIFPSQGPALRLKLNPRAVPRSRPNHQLGPQSFWRVEEDITMICTKTQGLKVTWMFQTVGWPGRHPGVIYTNFFGLV